MKDIIWALDDEQSSIFDLVAKIQSFANEVLLQHQIHLKFEKDISKEAESIMLSSGKKRNILLIVKEGLHNIIKHSEASHVEFFIQGTAQIFKMNIQEGIGTIAFATTSFGDNGYWIT